MAGSSRRKLKDTRKKILRSAEELAAQMIADNGVEELTRVGVVWSGILNLENPISASDVAAMMSAHDLIKATNFVDSEEYWVGAAAYAAMGAYGEPHIHSESSPVFDQEDEGERTPIGFTPGHTKTSN